jgi:PAT family beta-lactamase induction signal transducer AmpG
VSRLHFRPIYLIFAALYFTQGAVLAYITNFQKPFLKSQGASLEAIGWLTSALLLPFILKIFLGAWSDRVSLFSLGHRRPYMLFGLLLSTICFAGLSQIHPANNFLEFSACIFAACLGIAIFDTCADAWAIEVSQDDESAPIQSSMMAGRAAGLILLSWVFGQLAHDFHFSRVFVTLAGLCGLAWVIVFFKVREPRGPREAPTWRAQFRPLTAYFTTDRAFFVAYALLYSIFSFGLDGLITLHWAENLKLNGEGIGNYGSLRGIGAVIGALLAGWCAWRWGRGRTARRSLVLLSAAGLSLLLIESPTMAVYAGVLWGTAWSFQETCYVILAMLMADRHAPATSFALLMVFSNIGTSIGEALGTQFAQAHGYPSVIAACAIGALALSIFMPWLARRPSLAHSLSDLITTPSSKVDP